MEDGLEDSLHVVLKPAHDLSRYENWAAIVRKVEVLDFCDLLWTEILCEMAGPPYPGQFDKLSLSKPVERRLKKTLRMI